MLWLLLAGIISCQVLPVRKYGQQSSSQIEQVYSESSAITGNSQTFAIPYPQAKSAVPQVVLSLSGFDNSNLNGGTFRLSLQGSTQSEFDVQIEVAGMFHVYMVDVSYFSIVSNYSNSYFGTGEYISFNYINSGNGDRTDSLNDNFLSLTGFPSLNNNNSHNHMICFLTGFQLNAAANVDIRISTKLDGILVEVNVSTSQDCIVEMVKLQYWFIDDQQWQNSMPSVNFFSTLYSAFYNSLPTPTYSFTNMESQNYMIGLLSLSCDNQGSLKFQLAPSSDKTMVELVQAEPTYESLQFQFVYLAEVQCPDSHPFYADSNQASCVTSCLQSQTAQPMDTVCRLCDSPCLTCQASPSDCSSCESGYVLSPPNCNLDDDDDDDGNNGNDGNDGNGNGPGEGESSMIWVAGVAAAPILLISTVAIYCYCKRPPRIAYQEDIRTHPSIDIL